MGLTLSLLGGTVLLSRCDGAESVTATSLHSVTGSALVDMRNDSGPEGPLPVVFQAFISAHQDVDGAWGTVEANAFMRYGEAAVPISFTATVNCLMIDGKSAWIGATVVASNHASEPVGARYLLLVRDRGGPGSDIMHLEQAQQIGNPRCTDKPTSLAETIVDEGDYDVR